MQSNYLQVEAADTLENLSNTAAHLLLSLKKSLGETASYNQSAIEALSNDLDRNRDTYNRDEATHGKVLWMYGAFLGKAIIESVGSERAVWVDNKVDNYCLRLTTSKGEEVMASPFTRVIKHLKEGGSSSMLAYFIGVDDVVKNGLPHSR